ncbi:LANO_0G06216g1_1 [Lachancea nothofagi CBS 11611]|uniref:NADH-cytochrome b5 reductase n=1 Tax=Lachancea nothofagi CBS 11611 TaxID=1266666 RepID=A0A1G4KH05_9SACH|nr:LANO_0G06216g1_1 [Lachancea nothofagi CBS 11611]
MSEGHNLLDDPVHGIYIPVGLLLTGLAITCFTVQDYKFLWILPFAALLLAVRFTAAYRRRKSVFSDRWTNLELEDQTLISKNTAIYRFNMKTTFESLNFPVGHHLAVKVPVDGKDYIRYYTPVSPKLEPGHFDIIVKSYPDGNVSKYFAGLKPGSTVAFKGPVGRFNYVTNSYKHLAMIAGGSGITPMLQVLNEVITNPEDFTKVSLIYANESENDILLRDELDEIAEKYPNFDVTYVLRTPPANWTGETGYVTKEQILKYLPHFSSENRLLISGKPEMVRMLLGYAEDLGWPKTTEKSKGDDQVFAF